MALNLKQLRMQRGLTLEQLAQRSGLTRSYVSKVERSISTPSISSAMGLAEALEVSVERLFGQADGQESPVTISRGADTNKDKESYLSLVAGLNPDRKMRAFVVRPGKKSGRGRPMTHHDGEELLYVLKGRIELRVGKDIHQLAPGDCVHFDSAMPHQLLSVGSVAASALVVISSEVPSRR